MHQSRATLVRIKVLGLTRAKRQRAEEKRERQLQVVDQLSPTLQSAVEQATDDGASSSLSAWPTKEHGFAPCHTKELIEMQSHYVTDGSLLTFLRIAPVEVPVEFPFYCCHGLTCRKGGRTIALLFLRDSGPHRKLDERGMLGRQGWAETTAFTTGPQQWTLSSRKYQPGPQS